MNKVSRIVGSIIIWAIYYYIIYMYNGNLSQKDMLVYGFVGFIQYAYGGWLYLRVANYINHSRHKA